MTRTTICKDCEHFHNLEPGSVRADAWYNHLCLASPTPKVRNLVTGEYEAGFAYCRDINDGRCPKFSARSFSETAA